MENKTASKSHLPESFWTAYIALCLRQWLEAEAGKSKGGDDHGATAIAPRPPVESRRVDTA